MFQTPLSGLGDPAAFTPPQRTLSDAFSGAWANFVKSGMPAPHDAWPPFDPKAGNVEVFTPTGVSQRTDFATDHRCGLWSSLALR
ncbi:hypothetical protein [Deinococcus sp.]|uniref:hypothetical protein n=1 Tax=Deinococcus sp. TaxID=47478 RepID=UPI002869912F|nr:hypothetical protein [Deinococcus sp.]